MTSVEPSGAMWNVLKFVAIYASPGGADGKASAALAVGVASLEVGCSAAPGQAARTGRAMMRMERRKGTAASSHSVECAAMTARVVITGASMGIGRALALAWAERGAQVVL